MTKAELFTWYFDQKDKLGMMYSEGKITKPEYNQLVDKLDKQLNDASDLIDQGKEPKLTNVETAPSPAGMTGTSGTSGTMTPEEYKAAKSAMYKKYKAGEITNYAYIQWKKKNNPALNGAGGAVSSPAKAKAQTPAPTTNPGTKAADAAVAKLEKELKQVYGQAAAEMRAQLDELIQKFGPEMKQLELEFINGTISAEDLKWLQAKQLEKKILGQKIDQLTGTMLEANKKAMGMISGEQVNVFAENANYQAYQLTQDTGVNLMFSVYDEHTAKKLLKEKPELLPRKEVNGKKDKAWNQKTIANAVLQAVIQGESIPKLAKRIAAQTGETNRKAMVRYARTAMTSAQNSGRMEMLHQAKGMGIKCKKRWLATLDSRTRDAHGKLDGQTVDVDEPFKSDFGDIMFPGDMSSKGSVPGNLYNCRCTLIYEYEDFPNDPTADQRMQYNEYYTEETDEKGKTHKVYHREGSLVTDMNYDEWKAAKSIDKLNDLNAAKHLLAEAQKAVVSANVKEDKIYEGIWKDPVTLADYPAKKAGIQAKRDYYDTEIQKYKDAQAAGYSWATDEKIKTLQKNLKALNEFEKRGQLIEKRDKALQAVQDIYGQAGFGKIATVPNAAQIKAKKTAKKAAAASGGASAGAGAQTAAGLSLGAAGAKKTPFGPEAYTKERKDKALWTTNKKKVDSMMRGRTGEVWRAASDLEKDAIYEYTQSYHKFNEPLRGIEYGTNVYKGVGKTDLNAGGRRNGRFLDAMTDIIDKCSYDHDQWLQRGVGFSGMDKFFGCSEHLLRYGSQKELQDALLGTTPTEYGFMSMGSAKGNGFSGNILMNIYAPAGTKMMYVEPFSAFSGHHVHRSWDGLAGQSAFGREFETIMQQGTQFRITKVEKTGGQIYVDMEVINQDNQQRWKKK